MGVPGRLRKVRPLRVARGEGQGLRCPFESRDPLASPGALPSGEQDRGPTEGSSVTQTYTVVSSTWVLAVPHLAAHQAHGALCVSLQALLPASGPSQGSQTSTLVTFLPLRPPPFSSNWKGLVRSLDPAHAPPGTQVWFLLPASPVPLRHPAHPPASYRVPARARDLRGLQRVWRPLSAFLFC